MKKNQEKILLQDILPLDELKKLGKVLLIRHTNDHLEKMVELDLIDEYQSFQRLPSFRNCKYIVSFIGAERNSAIFYGLFEVSGLKEKNSLPLYSKELVGLCSKQDLSTDFCLQLKKIEEFDKFKNRLIIDWVIPRGWQNEYGKVINKTLTKLLPMNFLRNFPGLMNVKLKYDELEKIIQNPDANSEWYDAFTRLQAVYLIQNKIDGSLYVGTTYGENGLWQRWASYTKGEKTGGNVGFIKLKAQNPNFYKNLEFSILEVLSKTADKNYCLDKEKMWMQKLGTRVHGLN